MLGLGERERDYLLAWVGENLTLVRRTASRQRPIYWILGTGFVVGLAAHAGGFLLRTSVTTEVLLLVADLLYALGWALWTSVIVVLFVQIWPDAKKRQYQQALDAYEARQAVRPEPDVARTRRARGGVASAASRAGHRRLSLLRRRLHHPRSASMTWKDRCEAWSP